MLQIGLCNQYHAHKLLAWKLNSIWHYVIQQLEVGLSAAYVHHRAQSSVLQYTIRSCNLCKAFEI